MFVSNHNCWRQQKTKKLHVFIWGVRFLRMFFGFGFSTTWRSDAAAKSIRLETNNWRLQKSPSLERQVSYFLGNLKPLKPATIALKIVHLAFQVPKNLGLSFYKPNIFYKVSWKHKKGIFKLDHIPSQWYNLESTRNFAPTSRPFSVGAVIEFRG